MILSLSEMMSVPDKVTTLEVPLEVPVVEFQGMRYEFTKKPPFSVRITNQNQKRLLVEGNADYTISIPCSRCLTSVEVPISVQIQEVLNLNENNGQHTEELEQEAYLNGYHLDMDLLIMGEILLALPDKVLCKEDCKGLCPLCGKNQNEGECDCRKEPSDPRMAQIRDIFEKFKEV